MKKKMMKINCKIEGHDYILYNELYDAHYCRACLSWKESKCSDKLCQFCKSRPNYAHIYP